MMQINAKFEVNSFTEKCTHFKNVKKFIPQK